MNDIALLALIWIAWCLLHSVLILPSWLAFLRRRTGSAPSWYRLAYVLFSIVSLLPVLWFQAGVHTAPYLSSAAWWTVPRIAALAAGLLLLALGARAYDQSFFFGLRQLRTKDGDGEFSGFSTQGILGRVRHPYYSGGMLVLLGFGSIDDAWLVSRAVLIAYLIVGAWWEERKLRARIGEEYARYQAAVPMFVPRLWRH